MEVEGSVKYTDKDYVCVEIRFGDYTVELSGDTDMDFAVYVSGPDPDLPDARRYQHVTTGNVEQIAMRG